MHPHFTLFDPQMQTAVAAITLGAIMEPTETLTFLGTIAELKAVLKASKVKHFIEDEEAAYLEVDLRGRLMTGATIDIYGSRDKANARYARGNRDNRYTYAVRRNSNALAKGIIKGTGNGSTVDLEVDLETDETMPMHKEVHERWQQFYAYLISRGRLAQELEAAAAPTEIDGRPEQEVLDQLTDRVKEVAVCLAQGLRRLQIANKLVISDNTVKVHFNEIARKWNLTTTKGEILQAEAKRRGYG